MRMNHSNAVLRCPLDEPEARERLVERMETRGYELQTEGPGTYGTGRACLVLRFRETNTPMETPQLRGNAAGASDPRTEES